MPKPQNTEIKVKEEVWKASNPKVSRHKRFPGAQIPEQRKKQCFYSRHMMLNSWVSSRDLCTHGKGRLLFRGENTPGTGDPTTEETQRPLVGTTCLVFVQRTSQQCLQSFINHHGAKLSLDSKMPSSKGCSVVIKSSSNDWSLSRPRQIFFCSGLCVEAGHCGCAVPHLFHPSTGWAPPQTLLPAEWQELVTYPRNLIFFTINRF